MIMPMTLPLQRAIGLIVIIVLGAWLMVRLYPLRLLYLDSEARASAEKALRTVGDRRGWLLSDIRIDSVDHDTLKLTYRPHIRGSDPWDCHVLQLDDSFLNPCDAAR
jgi:hypothetical protein